MSTDERPTWLTRLAPAVVRSAKGIIRRIVPGREDDVWQDILISISQEPERIPVDDRAFRSWVWRTARYFALNARRRRSETLAADDEALERMEGSADPFPSPSGFDALAFHQLAELTNTYIDTLQPILREVLLLSMSGVSTREIAELLGGIPEDVVRTRLKRARNKLAAKLAEDGFDVPRTSEPTEERMATGISIDNQRALIYAQICSGAEPQADGTRVRYHGRPAEVVYDAAHAAGFTTMSRPEAAKLMGKIPRDWLELDWKGGGGRGCRMICKTDPTTLLNGGPPKSNGAATQTAIPVAKLIPLIAAYKRLAHRDSTNQDQQGRYTREPLRNLSGKFPGRDATGTLEAIIANGWAAWREVEAVGVEGKVRRLYLLVDELSLRDPGESQHRTPDAPPEREVVAVRRSGEDAEPDAPVDEKAAQLVIHTPSSNEPAPDFELSAPPATAPVEAAPAPSPAPTALPEEPMPPAAPPAPKRDGRLKQGLRGVYMTHLETRVWGIFVKHTECQPHGGWDPTLAKSVGLALVMNDAKTTDREEIGEVIGRMCAAEILTPTAPDEWAVAWNPQGLYVEKLDEDRRMILTDAGRMDQIEKARELARKLANEQGVIDTKIFSNEASGPLGLAPGAIMTLLLDYYTAAAGKAGEALRVLVRYNPEDVSLCTTLLLAPDSLSGCDYFPAEAGRVRSAVVGENHPRHGHFRGDLRARYLTASKFKSAVTTPPVDKPTPPPPEEPAAPPATAPVEAAPAPSPAPTALPSTSPPAAAEPVPAAPPPPPVEETVGEALARLEARRTELAEAERVARTKAEEFTRLAAERVAQADQFARERESVEADLTETRKAADELARLDLDMAKILARKDELLAFLKKS